jgi:hypothetical protein
MVETSQTHVRPFCVLLLLNYISRETDIINKYILTVFLYYFLSACQQNDKFTICNTITPLHNLWRQENFCDYHLRFTAA